MVCTRCHNAVPKLFIHPKFTGPICGCCQITLSRRFPGVKGFAYVDGPDEVEAAEDLVKTLNRHPDPRQHFPEAEAVAFIDSAKRDKEARLAAKRAIPDKMVEAERELVEHEAKAEEQSIVDAQKRQRKALRELNPAWSDYKREMGITP